MPNREVSEKTLELNVTAEILEIVRNQLRFQKAFWFGMTQRQEAQTGLDEILTNLPRAYHLLLQFKSPAYNPSFKFSINKTQTLRLLDLSSQRPDAVFYVFPLFNRIAKLKEKCPNLLKDTWLLRVEDLRNYISGSQKERHSVIIEKPPLAFIRSTPMRVRLLNLKGYLLDLTREYDFKEKLISNSDIHSWHKAENWKFLGNKRLGQLCRGLGSVVFSAS
jgi:hypothetical protein